MMHMSDLGDILEQIESNFLGTSQSLLWGRRKIV